MINPTSSTNEIVQLVLSLIEMAATDKKHPMHFAILGTINKEIPEMRYVVWRNFDVEHLSGQIYTDVRSDKIRHLLANSCAQLLFYDPEEKCQIRVNVEIKVHNQTKQTTDIYKTLGGGFEAYNTLQAPGTACNSFENASEMKPEYKSEDFAVLETKFLSMEVLELSAPQHIRFEYNFVNKKFGWLVP